MFASSLPTAQCGGSGFWLLQIPICPAKAGCTGKADFLAIGDLPAYVARPGYEIWPMQMS
jgi:hypothetical protein